MPKVLLLQFDTDPDCEARRELVKKTGVTVVEAEPRWPVFFDVVTRERPDIIVVACSRIPSHAFECARYLGDGFNTRDIPVVLIDVLLNDITRARSSAPRARILTRDDLVNAIQQTLNLPLSS